MNALIERLSKLADVRKKMDRSSRRPQRVMRKSITYGFSALLAVFCLLYLRVVWAGYPFVAHLGGIYDVTTTYERQKSILYDDSISNLMASSHSTVAQSKPNGWTSNGPEGGTITAFAITPNNTSILYTGTNSGSIFKSTNGGASWSFASLVEIGIPIITLAIDPSNQNIIYAGTLHNLGRGGAFKSSDGGKTWRAVNTGLPTSNSGPSFYVNALVIDPINPLTLYLGAEPFGVFKSNDGGINWASISSGLTTTNVYTLVVDQKNPSTIYAGTGLGIFKSVNAGTNWSPANTGLSGSLVVRALAINHGNSFILYAGDNRGEIFRSVDKGASWSKINSLFFIDVETLVVDPKSTSTLYAKASRSRGSFYSYLAVYKSTDGGLSWSSVNNGLPNITVIESLAIDPNNPSILYAGAVKNDGVFKSIDGGANWVPANTGLNATIVQALSIAPDSSTTIYAATSAIYGTGLFKSNNSGASWNRLFTNTETIPTLTADPSNPSILYAGMDMGGIIKSVDGGVNWRSINNGLPLFDTIYGLSLPTIQALAVDPSNPSIIYAGTRGGSSPKAGVYKSMDGGANWSVMNSGLSNFNAVVTTLVVDPRNPSLIYAGTYGGIFKSINGGSTWNRIGGGLVNALAIDPSSSSILYAAFSGGGVFKSADGGISWNPVNNGLPSPVELPGYIDATTLAVDPKNPSTVYVGLGMTNVNNTISVGGVFRSTNGGLNWSGFNDGLIYPDIRAMVISPSGSSLHVATNGGGVFDIQLGPGCSITCTATAPTAGIVGTAISFSATATPTGCVGLQDYDWDFGDGSPHSSQQNPTHTYAAAGNYNWKMTFLVRSHANGVTSCTRSGTISIGAQCAVPNIATQPVSQAVANGQTATLNVVASGSRSLAYQWYKGMKGDTSNPVVGETSGSYITPALSSVTNYWVRVSNSCGKVNSETATITVLPIPITTQPADVRLFGHIDKNLDTIVLTHGLSKRDDLKGAPDSLWTGNTGDTEKRRAGFLIREYLKQQGKLGQVNILQYVWNDAFQVNWLQVLKNEMSPVMIGV